MPRFRYPSWNCPSVCALGAVAGFYLSAVLFPVSICDRLFPVFVCIPGALGVVGFSRSSVPWKRFGLACMVLACAALFFTCRRFEYDAIAGAASFGMEDTAVTSFTGVCTDDSSKTSSGRTILKLKLIATGGYPILHASASGAVVVLMESRESYSWGEVCSVRAPLGRDPDGTIFSFPGNGTVVRKGWNFPVFEARAGIRRLLLSATERVDPDALLSALFLGDLDRFSPAVYDDFRKAGAVHILALSGMHLGLIAMLLSVLLRPLLGRKHSARMILAVLAFYMFIAGPKPSLIRAGLMTFFAWVFTELGRNTEPVVIPSLAFVLYLLIDPGAAFGLGFQLSFLAITGIILIGPFLTARLLPFCPKPLAAGLSASVAAQVFTAPVIVCAFGVLYPAGIFSSLLLGPLTTVFLWIGLAGVPACACLPSLGTPFTAVLHFLFEVIIMVVGAFAEFPSVGF